MIDNTKAIEGVRRTLWQWVFNPPTVGEPSAHVSIAHALHRLSIPLIAAVVLTRSQAYYLAGCPVDLCEASAARDVWAVMVCAGERGNGGCGGYGGKSSKESPE